MGDQFGQIAGRISSLEDNINRLMAQQTDFATSGAAFPTDNLFTGRRFFRTDRAIDYYYDGTRWLTVALLPIEFAIYSPTAFAQAVANFDTSIPNTNINGIFLDSLIINFFNLTAQSGTNFYTVTFTSVYGSAVTLGGTTDTKAFTVNNTWHAMAITFASGAVQAVNSSLMQFTLTPSANPGTFFIYAALGYRLIG